MWFDVEIPHLFVGRKFSNHGMCAIKFDLFSAIASANVQRLRTVRLLPWPTFSDVCKYRSGGTLTFSIKLSTQIK